MSNRCPVDGHGPAPLEADRDVLRLDLDRRVPEPHAHDRLDRLDPVVEVLEVLRLVGSAADVRVGRVGLLRAVAVRQVVVEQPGAHLLAAAELADERRVEPRLVDAQVRVGEQPVAVEALDVVALVRRAVAPDLDVVLQHRAHQQRAGDRPAERGRVEVAPAARADMERAAGQRGQPLLHEGRAAVDQPGDLGAVRAWPARGRTRCRARRTARGRRCRCTAPHPSRASTRPRQRCRARRRRRCRPVHRWAGRRLPWTHEKVCRLMHDYSS